MTANILQSELSSLIHDSKRRHPDVRTAAEKSLGELKAITITSEKQLAGDLVRNLFFVDPFVVACSSRNAKLVGSGVVCLQRLAASTAIPRQRLKDVLHAFRDVLSFGLDVQLKILQTLPSLLQIYSEDIRDELLASTLTICGTLQSSKTAVVSSTAAAAFQQLVATVYERVALEDERKEVNSSNSVGLGGETFNLQPAAFDAFRVSPNPRRRDPGSFLYMIRRSSVGAWRATSWVASSCVEHFSCSAACQMYRC